MAAVFPIYYQPVQQISKDKMMIGTRCKVLFLQYLRKKPDGCFKYLQYKYCTEGHTPRLGIKVWVNSEAKSGYVSSLQREKSLPIPALSTYSRRKFIIQALCVPIIRDFRKSNSAKCIYASRLIQVCNIKQP